MARMTQGQNPSQSREEYTFETLHKYIAKVFDDINLVQAKDVRLSIERRVEFFGETMVADWKDMAHRLVDDRYICYFIEPANSWQHFKQDYFPLWFKRRYPVKTITQKRFVRFTRYATYPMAYVPKELLKTRLGGIERIEDKVEVSDES